MDVAEQVSSAHTDSDVHRAVLATAEADGVHYVWWLAVRRNYFLVEGGKRTPHGQSPPLEPQPGHVRVPLLARARDPRAGGNWVSAVVEVTLPAEAPSKSLPEVASQTRRDVLLVGRRVDPVVTMFGAVRNNQLGRLDPANTSDAEFAEDLRTQLEWLQDHDEVSLTP